MTRLQRMSAINPGCPWRGPMVDPAPTGSGRGERAAAAFIYAGSTIALASLSGILSFTGAITRDPATGQEGSFGFDGQILRQPNEALAAVLSFLGAITKDPATGLDATLGFGGQIIRQPNKALAGVLGFIGSITDRAIGKTLAGALSFSGTITKLISRTLTGVLSFVGTVDSVINGGTFAKTITAALSFTGQITKALDVDRGDGNLTLGSQLVKDITKSAFSGAVSLIGGLLRQPNKGLVADLDLNGQMGNFSLFKGLSGSLTPTGSVQKQVQRLIVAVLTMTATALGAVGGSFEVAIAGTLSFSGVLTAAIIRFIAHTVYGPDYLSDVHGPDYLADDTYGPDYLTDVNDSSDYL